MKMDIMNEIKSSTLPYKFATYQQLSNYLHTIFNTRVKVTKLIDQNECIYYDNIIHDKKNQILTDDFNYLTFIKEIQVYNPQTFEFYKILPK